MDAPFSLLRLDHLVLRTTDVPRLVAFYRMLGCNEVRRIEALNMTQLRAGSSMLDIVGADDSPQDGPGRNLDHFAIRVEPFDLEGILAFCRARGIDATPMERLLGADGYGPAVYLRDPDGNRVELKGPPVAAPPG